MYDCGVSVGRRQTGLRVAGELSVGIHLEFTPACITNRHFMRVDSRQVSKKVILCAASSSGVGLIPTTVQVSRQAGIFEKLNHARHKTTVNHSPKWHSYPRPKIRSSSPPIPVSLEFFPQRRSSQT